jgi:hypothetical protein
VQRSLKGCDTFTTSIGLQAAGRIYRGERWPASGPLSIACQLTTAHWMSDQRLTHAPRQSRATETGVLAGVYYSQRAPVPPICGILIIMI